MSLETVVYAALTADAGITALVSNRVYTDVVDEGAVAPLIVFTRTATEFVTTIHDGAPAAEKGTLALSAYALGSVAAQQIADAAVAALHAVGIPINRFEHHDVETGTEAAVVVFDVWDV